MKDVKLTPGVKYQDVAGAGGDNIIAKRRSRNVPAMKYDMTPYFDLEYWRARDNLSLYGVHIQIGNQPGNTIVISSDACQIQMVDRVSNDNLVGQTVTLAAQDNRAFQASGSLPFALDIWKSPFTISFI